MEDHRGLGRSMRLDHALAVDAVPEHVDLEVNLKQERLRWRREDRVGGEQGGRAAQEEQDWFVSRALAFMSTMAPMTDLRMGSKTGCSGP